MKILAIAPDKLPLPPIKGGSVESVMHNFFTRLAHTDDVTLVSSAHSKLPSTNTLMNGKLTYHRFPYPNGSAYIQAAMRQMRSRQFDLIQVDNRPAFLPIIRQAFPDTPIVLSLHSMYFLSQLSRERGNSVLRHADGITCVSSSIANTFKAQYPRHAAKFKPMHLGVDTSKFQPRSSAYKASIRKKYGVDGTYNLLFVGRIIPRKGLHTLVEAAAMLRKKNKSIAIVAVGSSWPGVKRETPYMRKVRQLAKKLDVPIRFTGYVPVNRVHEMYHLADIFVCPTKFQEGFGLVNLEAMASGIPVVSSARGGIVEVIEHGRSGWLVNDYQSPRAFAIALSEIMNNSSLAKRLAAGGRKRAVSRFGWAQAVRALSAYYHSLV